jgi:hypothetical protein
MESARLDFINAARRHIVRSLVPVADLPVARPSPSEFISLSQPEIPALGIRRQTLRQPIRTERAAMPRYLACRLPVYCATPSRLRLGRLTLSYGQDPKGSNARGAAHP